MELDLGKKTVYKVKLEGETYEVKKPSVREISSFNKKIKDVDATDQFDITKDWVASLGMPSEVVEDLEMDQFTQLLDMVSGLKKS